MFLDPAKLGISMVVSVVLLIGGVMALAKTDPSIVIKPTKQSQLVASDDSVQNKTVTSDEEIVSTAEAGNTAEQLEQEPIEADVKMEVDSMADSLENFDPITNGDWSLDNLSNNTLGVE